MDQAEQKQQSETARKRKEFLFPAAATCLIIAFSFLTIFSQNTPPKARVDNVTDEYFGVKVTDPYRWMEDLKAKETQDWMKTQAAHADDVRARDRDARSGAGRKRHGTDRRSEERPDHL